MKGRKAELKTIDGGLKGVPKKPANLPTSMEAEWNAVAADMVKRKILTASMMGVLTTYIIAVWTVQECQEAIQKHGLLVETAHKMMKPNPASGIMAKAMEQVSRLSVELGLTPAARSKAGFSPKKGGDDDEWSGMDL